MDAIDVENLGKCYRLGELGAGTSLREAITTVARFRRRTFEELWALHDVSFRLGAGSTLGIIGRNGSGKSTMLKILTRITEPTTGRSRTRGRVASLLEVGTGFHEELTGRDNVYLNGAIHGMTRRDIDARFDRIVEFADVGRFLDTPIKRYSTGMHLRLAFSVAAHLEPDVLIVDEVLAVGDLEFQRRCLGRMEEAEREGRTVVFVSHDLAAVARLCERSIWLVDGGVRLDGPTDEVLEAYTDFFADTLATPHGSFRAGPVQVQQVRVLDEHGTPATSLAQPRPFDIELRFELDEPVPDLDLAFYLTNATGVRVLDEAWGDLGHPRFTDTGPFVVRLRVPPVLRGNHYRVGLWMGTPFEEFLDEPSTTRFDLEGGIERPYCSTQLDLPFRLVEQPVPLDPKA